MVPKHILVLASPNCPRADFDMFLCTAAVSVLEKMLLLDPECRVSASEALELPFFCEFRDADEETEALPYDQTMDNTDLPLDQWKRKRLKPDTISVMGKERVLQFPSEFFV